MARVGQNPAKKAPAGYAPRRITACTIVYIPRLDGFWQGSFDVLRASLGSLGHTAGDEVDLFVLDNGSCGPVKAYLEELHTAGNIDCLLTARANLGKAGAWNVLLPACPGQYVAYFDSDILFRPGWLAETLAIAGEFRSFGMITARPCRTSPELVEPLLGATLRFAAAEPAVRIQRGDLIPHAVIMEFAHSIGMGSDPLYTGPGADLLIRRNGVAAFGYAAHYQFLTTSEVIRRVLPIVAGRALGGVRPFDLKVNELGLLRLSTMRPLVHHLGNTISESERDEVERYLADVPRHHHELAWARVYGRHRMARCTGLVLRALVRNRKARRALEKVYLGLHAVLH